MGFMTRRYKAVVPKYLRDLGESSGAPRPNRFLPSAEAGDPQDVDRYGDMEDVLGERVLDGDADLIPEATLKVLHRG